MHAVEVGDGPPLVFLHALGWDHRQWEYEILRYRARYKVIAGDTRGHGASSKPGGPYDLTGFAADWQEMLDGLNVERACLVGFSLGGMIAQYMAIRNPERVAALVLVSTVCQFDAGVRAAMEDRIVINRKMGARAAAEAVAKSLFTQNFRDREPGFLETFYAWRVTQPQDCIVDSIRATFDLDTCARLSSLNIPCMVIAGSDDVATPPEAVAALARQLPNAELQIVDGAAHMLTIERPRAFTSLLDNFLACHYPSDR